MTKKSKPEPCFVTINGDSKSASLVTENLFMETPHKPTKSPIDIFVNRNKALMTKLGELERANILDDTSDDDRHIYNLFLLGFVSNVESYFRSIIREIIIIDSAAFIECLEEPLAYAAAVHHKLELLPEALLEHCTFISAKNITDSIKNFVGISLCTQETRVKEVTECLCLFEQLCQLRHCIVHRAGLLGSKNAIKLGFDQHKNFFEKPIVLDLNFLQNSSVICLNSVRTTNSLLFNKLVHRYIETHDSVCWDYRKDSKWFKKYFNLFSSISLNTEMSNSGQGVISCLEAYNKFRDSFSM